MLGILDMAPKHGKSMLGKSSHGQGTVKLQPEDGDGSYPWCLIYCRSCWASSLNKFVIMQNDQQIGEIKCDKADGKVSVSFPPTLDSRLKGIIVIGAFAIVRLKLYFVFVHLNSDLSFVYTQYNMYWRPALCCGCCC